VNKLKPKELVPEWLIEIEEDIDSYIAVLQAAKKHLVSISISPVNILTDIAVELLMKLRYLYQNEAPKSERKNPAIIFDESQMGDLGLPPQRTINFKVQGVWSPQMEKFLFHLAIFFSRSLKTNFSFEKDFHDLIQKLDEFLPPGTCSQKSIKAEKSQKNIKQVRAQKARKAYYRRRSKGK
jgi:hypothetical protein